MYSCSAGARVCVCGVCVQQAVCPVVHTPLPIYCVPFLFKKEHNRPTTARPPLNLLSLCSDGLGGVNVLVPLGGAALSLALFSAVEGFPDTDNTARPLLLWTGTIT